MNIKTDIWKQKKEEIVDKIQNIILFFTFFTGINLMNYIYYKSTIMIIVTILIIMFCLTIIRSITKWKQEERENKK